MKPIRLMIPVILLLLVACSHPKQDIVGSWQRVDSTGTLTFHADGSFEIGSGPSALRGQYRILENGRLHIEYADALGDLFELGALFSGKHGIDFAIRVTDKTLVMTEATGKTWHYQRIATAPDRPSGRD